MSDLEQSIQIKSICNICLSKDRTLKFLKNVEVPPEWILLGLNIMNGAVCWECEAVIRKCILFKKKVVQAQLFIQSGVEDPNIKSLSTLSYAIHDIKSFDNDIITKRNTNIKIEHVKESDIANECVKEEINSDSEHQFETVFSDIIEEKDELSKQLPLSDSDNFQSETLTNIKYEDLNYNESEDDEYNTNRNDYIELPITIEELIHMRNKEKRLRKFKQAKFSCVDCVKIFYTLEQFNKHINKYHIESLGDHVCSLCECRYKDAESLHRHSQTHLRQYKCRVCVFHHYSVVAMNAHTERNHDKETYTCQICSTDFRSKRAYRNHTNTEHREPCKCERCGKLMKSLTHLKEHLRVTHAQEQVTCEVCQQTFRGKKRLRYHMLSHSQRERDIAYCAECDIQFENRYKYRIHLKSNKHGTPEERSQCPHCEKKFVNKRYVEQHISIVHLNKLNFVCKVCDKRFSTSGNLKIHMSIYHEPGDMRKKHICAVCGTSFTSKHGLKGHMNRHTGERPHKCDECTAAFSQHGGLYKHKQRVHKMAARTRNS